jgi:D-alanine-D-alanine ligase
MQNDKGDMKKDKEKIRVTVLAGGPSRERPVSQVSGKAVAEALARAGFEVTMADILPSDLSALDIPADVIFPVLHGVFGEDGQVQEIIEARGLAYCGSGPQACRVSMNKFLTKRLAVNLGVPTPAYDVITTDADIAAARACWSVPVVVKPLEEGSSFGVTIVKKADDLERVIRETLKQYGPSMVEKFIPGRELTVGILDNQALPIIEICPTHEFYDYDAKYSASDTRYEFVQDLPTEVYQKIQALSVKVAAGMELRDFCRVDWRLDPGNNPFLLETNALPGFTGHSLVPMASMAGIDMESLCRRIVEMALARGAVKTTGKQQQVRLAETDRIHGKKETVKIKGIGV